MKATGLLQDVWLKVERSGFSLRRSDCTMVGGTQQTPCCAASPHTWAPHNLRNGALSGLYPLVPGRAGSFSWCPPNTFPWHPRGVDCVSSSHPAEACPHLFQVLNKCKYIAKPLLRAFEKCPQSILEAAERSNRSGDTTENYRNRSKFKSKRMAGVWKTELSWDLDGTAKALSPGWHWPKTQTWQMVSSFMTDIKYVTVSKTAKINLHLRTFQRN